MGSPRGKGSTWCFCGTVQNEESEAFCWSLPSQERWKGEATDCIFTAVLHGSSAEPGDCRVRLVAPEAVAEGGTVQLVNFLF